MTEVPPLGTAGAIHVHSQRISDDQASAAGGYVDDLPVGVEDAIGVGQPGNARLVGEIEIGIHHLALGHVGDDNVEVRLLVIGVTRIL